MIRKVKFSNFYSFDKEQEIDFLAKKKRSYDYFNSETGDQISKVAGFIGANASGKTNVMRFFSFLRYFVCESSKEEMAENLNVAYKTFFNNEKVSKFFVEFELPDFLGFYEFQIKKNIIQKEALSVRRKQKGAKKIEVFKRGRMGVIDLHEKFFGKFPIDFLKSVREDISLLAFLKAHYNIEIINNVFDYFYAFKTNINERGEINNVLHQINSLELYLENIDLKKKMEDFVAHFDLGLSGFVINKTTENLGAKIEVQGIRKLKEADQHLDFSCESRGTRSLFFTLSNILLGLKNNSVIIIDEIESGLHPEALNKIINYFIDENEKGCAQLIFSSHSLGFMEKLDMHQIYLVEKGGASESEVYRLNQIKNIRSDENFYSKYMSGAYGAFPKIRV